MKTFWELWVQDVPNKEKKAIIEHFMAKWELSRTPTIRRLKGSQFKFLTSDLKDLYEKLSIAYDLEKGFFVDYKRKEYLSHLQTVSTNLYGLSK